MAYPARRTNLASLANFHVVAPTLSDVENVYFQSRSQDQMFDIDGLTWTYDNTVGAEAYKAEIDLAKTKSEQISAYGRTAAAIHADLKKLKAGAGDSFEVSVMADFLSKPVLGGFTKEDGDDKPSTPPRCRSRTRKGTRTRARSKR